mgnify:FL=1
MRNRIKIACLACLLLTGCEQFTPQKMALVIYSDRTDQSIVQPTLADVQSVVDTKSNPNLGVDVIYQHIGDTDYIRQYNIQLPAVTVLENTHQRNSDTKRFYKRLDSLLLYENAQQYHYKNSSVLFPLLELLQELQNGTTNNNVILLYSDLTEFSDLYNSYANRKMLLENPLQVAKELKEKVQIPKVVNTQLYLIYEPKTKEQNRMFRSWVLIYKELFTEKGIKVKVGLEKQWHHE